MRRRDSPREATERLRDLKPLGGQTETDERKKSKHYRHQHILGVVHNTLAENLRYNRSFPDIEKAVQNRGQGKGEGS